MMFFEDAFFECVLASIFAGFLEALNLENMHGAQAGAPFSQNQRFRKTCEKTSILESFSEPKTTKNREKNVLKSIYFFDIDFFAIFFVFLRFLLNFGTPRALQKIEKLKKSIFERVQF